MNLFARALEGIISDKTNQRMEMRGRIIVQTFFLIAEGAFALIFAHTQNLGASILVLVFFSVLVQAAEGASYGIIPYVSPSATGTIAGIVGAGGNTGAIRFGLGFRNLAYREGVVLMGCSALGSARLSGLFYIDGYSALFHGKHEGRIQYSTAVSDSIEHEGEQSPMVASSGKG